jgi:hydroxyacylglutathione hydrolase
MVPPEDQRIIYSKEKKMNFLSKKNLVILSLCFIVLSSMFFVGCSAGTKKTDAFPANEKIKIIDLGFVNVFLISVKDGFMLIDTGTPGSFDKIEKALADAGCTPDKLKLVLITHGDFDHTGNAAKLQEKYKVKIAMHEGDKDMAESGKTYPREIRNFSFKIMFALGKLFGNKNTFEKFIPDILLADGQSLINYGLDAKVLYLPGHTKGSIALLTSDGNLFIGDTIFNFKKPVASFIIENEKALKESIDKIKKMDINVVYPSHGKPFVLTEEMKTAL